MPVTSSESILSKNVARILAAAAATAGAAGA